MLNDAQDNLVSEIKLSVDRDSNLQPLALEEEGLARTATTTSSTNIPFNSKFLSVAVQTTLF